MQQMKQGPPAFGSAQERDEIKIKPVVTNYDPHEAMRMAGVTDVAEEEQARAADAAAQAGRRTRLLCCCGQSGCSIGPFTNVEEY